MSRHIANAKAALNAVYDAEDNSSLLARAQTEALLAIAEELRSANLIAVLGSSWLDVLQSGVSEASTEALSAEIRERVLGDIRIERNVREW